MKKLFFILASVFIFNSAAIGQIPLEKCSNGSYQPPGQCPYYPPKRGPYHAFIAVDSKTGKWASADTYTSKSDAKKSVLSRCGKNCEYKHDYNRSCISAAYSAEDQILAFGSKKVGFLFDNSENSERRQKAAEDAMNKCIKKGGSNCKLLTAVCGYNHDR